MELLPLFSIYIYIFAKISFLSKLVSPFYRILVYIHTFIRFVCLFVCLMVFNATFSSISGISWQSYLLVEETGGPGKNHRPVVSH